MILVTGATGNVGKLVVKALVGEGAKVRALARNEQKANDLFGGLEVEIVRGDFDDPASIRRAVTDVEAIFLLCPVHRRQAQWNRTVIDAALNAGIEHIVRFSGITARPDALSELQRLHAVSDQDLMSSGMRYTILQSNSFYQNLFWSAGLIRAKGRFELPMGHARQSLVDLEDLVTVAVHALLGKEMPSQVLVVTGPEALSYHDVADRLSQVIGSPVKYEPVAWQFARDAMISAGMPEWNATVVVDFRRMVAAGECAEITDVVKAITQREPRQFDLFAEKYKNEFLPVAQVAATAAPRDARYHFLDHLATVLRDEPHRTAGMTATYQFVISGQRGGNFYVRIVDGIVEVGEGYQDDNHITIKMADEDYIAMATKEKSGPELFMSGKMKVSGDPMLGMKAEKIFG
jgi:uncharacterized protein YbjT (DUF2867 family)/putative sterol carrier protein